MSRFASPGLQALTPYTPGEQPRGRSFVKLNTNESPFPPSPLALKLAREEAGDFQLYSDPTCHVLRQAAAERFAVDPEEVICGNGSDDILSFIFAAFCTAERPALFPDVTYGFYPVFAAENGVPFREIPLRPDLTLALEDYQGLSGVVFLANPNAPTGLLLPVSAIEAFVQADPDRLVVVDEAYVDFGGESCIPLIRKYDNIFVVQTFSKSRSLAGARLGLGFGCKALIEDLNTLRYSINPYNVNRVTQAAGTGALADEAYFDYCRNRIMATRSRVAAALQAMGFSLTDSAANFLFAKHSALAGETLYKELKEKGVLVRHFKAPRLTDYIRITIGSDGEMDTFLAALQEILEAAK